MSRFDFVIIFKSGKLDGKPDALSRRLDYMHGDSNISSQEMTFLRFDYVDISLLNQDILKSDDVLLTLNVSIVQSMDVDNDLIQSIKNIFSKDRNIDSYIELFRDIILS